MFLLKDLKLQAQLELARPYQQLLLNAINISLFLTIQPDTKEIKIYIYTDSSNIRVSQTK